MKKQKNKIKQKKTVRSSVTSLYEGGFGGEKANLAAMDEVTPPITHSFTLFSLCFAKSTNLGSFSIMEKYNAKKIN